mgnify:CR=1 FL=1
MEIIGLFCYMAIGLCEYKLFCKRTVYIYTAFSGSIVIASCVIVAVYSCIEYCILKKMRKRINNCWCNITKFPVYCPNSDSAGNPFVFGCVIIVLVEVPV